MSDDIELPEVRSYRHVVRFFRNGEKDFVEISMVGHTDTVIHRVTPHIMAEYRDEWNAFCDGVPLRQRVGTPLTTLKDISEEKAADLVRRNVHTLEELAELNDMQCQLFGHGMLKLRTTARQTVALKRAREQSDASKKISVPVEPMKDNHPEMQALQDIVAEQNNKIQALMDMVGKMAAQPPAPQKAYPAKKVGPPRGKSGKPLAAVVKKQEVMNGDQQHSGDNEPSV